MTKLTILYQDSNFIAVHKPGGLFVHKSLLGDDKDNALKRLRNQLGHWVYAAHRLDRATSGVLLFAASPEAAGKMSELFRERRVEKTYHAVVRGYMEGEGLIQKPIKDEPHLEGQEAVTRFKMLATMELPIPAGRYDSARYSLVELKPETGRRHQLRKHCRHVFHPIVGDTVYGDGVHNRLWREHLGLRKLMLMARSLAFEHPYTGESISIHAPLEDQVSDLFKQFGWPLD